MLNQATGCAGVADRSTRPALAPASGLS